MTGASWAVVQHVDHEPPGLVTAVLAEQQSSVVLVRPDAGDAFPPLGALGGVVVLGGPMGVHDDGAHPWLVAERSWMAEAVAAGLPTVGICLGAQQLAMALGAAVTTGPAPEVGLGAVALTDQGLADDVLGPAGPELPAVHWHADTFTLPEGAALLASSAPYPNQVFRYGARVFGLQCHLEVDADLARCWRPLLPAGATIDEGARRRHEPVWRAVLTRMLSPAAVPAW